MSCEAFHHVLFPGTARVLGSALPVLNLWTLSVLQALGSPFVSADPARQFTLADLQVAVRCALTPVLKQPDLRRRFRDHWRHWRRRKDLAYLEQESTVFTRWLEVHQAVPELWQHADNDAPRFITAPLPLSQVAELMKLGMTHAEAWATRPGYARWLFLAAKEPESDRIRFCTDDDSDPELAEETTDEPAIRARACIDLDPETYRLWLAAREQILAAKGQAHAEG